MKAASPVRALTHPGLAAWLAVVVVACAAACSSESPDVSAASSSGGAENDASQASDGQTTKPSDAGDAKDAPDASTRQGMVLTLNGIDVPLDPSTFRASTDSDFNGNVWMTYLRANIVNGEAFSWNTDKVPLTVSLYDETNKRAPMPLGDFACLRGTELGAPDYGNTHVAIDAVKADGLHPLIEAGSEKEGCTTHFEQWEDGYRGTATGTLRSSGTTVVPFTLAWNLPPS